MFGVHLLYTPTVYVKLREGDVETAWEPAESVLDWPWWVRVLAAVWRGIEIPGKARGAWGGSTQRSPSPSWRRTPSPPNTRRVHNWPFWIFRRDGWSSRKNISGLNYPANSHSFILQTWLNLHKMMRHINCNCSFWILISCHAGKTRQMASTSLNATASS